MSKRFISPISNYKLVAIHEKREVLADGSSRTLAPGYLCEFRQGDTTDWEREIAREKLQFKGIPKMEDGTPLDPITRVSSFDTATIDDPVLRGKVEKSLLSNPDFGKQDGYILVEKPAIPIPWSTYDDLTVQGRRLSEHVAAKNIETAATTGTPLDHLIAYERDHRNDEAVIAAYEAEQSKQNEPETEDVLVEA